MFHFDWAGWTNWVPLIGLDFTTVPWLPGAYVIATSSPVNRAIDTDEEGFLDVGESDSLRSRLQSFVRCACNRGKEGYMAGWRYAFFHFDQRFPFSSLRVRWAAKATKAEAYRAEEHLLLAYLRRHAELPPLNYKFNWDAFEELGWDHLDPAAASQESTPPEAP
jgi:hypothetical protein